MDLLHYDGYISIKLQNVNFVAILIIIVYFHNLIYINLKSKCFSPFCIYD